MASPASRRWASRREDPAASTRIVARTVGSAGASARPATLRGGSGAPSVVRRADLARTVGTVAPAPFRGQPTGPPAPPSAAGRAGPERRTDRVPPGRSPRRGKLNPWPSRRCLSSASDTRSPRRAGRRGGGGRSRWFSPVRLGPLVAAERTWVPAMVPWRATEDGFVTPEVLDWYGRFAEGQPGVIVVEATGIRDVPSGPLLRIGHDRFVPGPATPRRDRARAEPRGGRASSSRSSTSSRIRRRPERGEVLRALPRARRRPPAPPGRGARRRTLAGRGWRAPDAEVRGAPRRATSGRWSSVLDRARARGARLRLPRAGHRPAPAAHPRAAAGAARASSPTPPSARARPASTASSCTTRTPTRWRRSSRAEHARTDGYGGSPPDARAAAARGARRGPRAASAPTAWSASASSATRSSRAATTSTTPSGSASSFARAGLDFLSLSKGGKFEDAQAAEGRRGRLSLHRRAATSACRP